MFEDDVDGYENYESDDEEYPKYLDQASFVGTTLYMSPEMLEK